MFDFCSTCFLSIAVKAKIEVDQYFAKKGQEHSSSWSKFVVRSSTVAFYPTYNNNLVYIADAKQRQDITYGITMSFSMAAGMLDMYRKSSCIIDPSKVRKFV